MNNTISNWASIKEHIFHNLLENIVFDAHPTIASSDRSLGNLLMVIDPPLLLAGPFSDNFNLERFEFKRKTKQTKIG